MLQELSIHDFAIISQLNVQFEDGMTVLTGETGAGKSIVIDAVSLLIGKRGSTDYIRKGAKKCQLEGLFTIQNDELYKKLAEYGIDCEDDMLVLQRDISTNGKNTCRVNGHLVNTTILKTIGSYLVDIQGQNEQQKLMQPEAHLELLDSFDPNHVQPLLREYHQIYNQYQEVHQLLERRRQNEKEYAQRIDMLKFQVNEIQSAHLEIGEEESLTEERNRLNNFLRIAEQLQTGYEALSDETNGSLTTIGVAMSALNDIASLSENYQTLADEISNAYYSLQDVANQLSNERDDLEMDEERQQWVEERLMLIRSLERKYGETVADVLSYYDKISKELEESMDEGDSLAALEEKEGKLYQKALSKAKELSRERHRMATQLTEKIHEQLKALYMDKAVFEVRFYPREQLQSNGIENVEFYISTNMGEDLKPLVKVVSGGELSRIMLALKTIFSELQDVTSIVFDEVDTGVSGRVAQAIAEKIHRIGQSSQVLCISHLPQVAAIADHHYYIQKSVHDGRTEMSLTTLDNQSRVDEIARMISGNEVTAATIEHAKELLNHK